MYNVAETKDEKEGEDREYWLATYADMVTLLLCFFIILFTSSKEEEQVLRAISLSLRGGPPASPYIFDGGPGFLNKLREEISSSKLLKEVTITTDDRGIVVQLGEAVLFNRGSAKLPESSKSVINTFAQLIQVIPNTIVVEGHAAPNFGGNRFYPSSWELSSVRASRVARELMISDINSKRLEIVAYGSTRSKVVENPNQAVSLNDRVEILIRPGK